MGNRSHLNLIGNRITRNILLLFRNRHIKTESATFVSLICFVFPKNLSFENISFHLLPIGLPICLFTRYFPSSLDRS